MPAIDFEKFRLRTFVNTLIDRGEVDIHEEPVALADLSEIIEGTDKATLFKKAGPQEYELVAAVAGSRRRLAAAFGATERTMTQEFMRRMENRQPVVEVPSGDAPVHEVVIQGDDIDLTTLPFFLQHELDGGVYISSGIDYSIDPATGKTNVGCRRLRLRDHRTMTSNLTGYSDLKKCYLKCLERGEKLPVSFTVGAHPLDYVTACLWVPTQDEFGLVGTMRGEPVPMVRGLTNGIPAPADAEMIIEGYFDELGYREFDGPYGEWWGYYGPHHIDPVFHVTAITKRKDMLHHSLLHGTSRLALSDESRLMNLTCEGRMWRTLRAVNIEPTAVYNVSAAAASSNVRVSLKRGTPGQAHAVISALFAISGVKNVVVIDDDLDVFCDDDIEWAMSTRFRPDKDVIIQNGYPRTAQQDWTPSEGRGTAKIGFDLTSPYERPDQIDNWRPRPPRIEGPPRCQTVRETLESGPKYFVQIMQMIGSRDGRDVALALEELRAAGQTERGKNGEWMLKGVEGAQKTPTGGHRTH